MPPKGDLGNMHMPIPLVTTVVGVVWRNRYECEEIECPTVAQQWVDRYRREEPEDVDPRLIAYGAYLLALRTVYGLRRRPRTPWHPVAYFRTRDLWTRTFRLVTHAQRERRGSRLRVRDMHMRRRIALARERALGPWQWTTRPRPFYCGPVWGTVRVRDVYERVEYGEGTVLGVGAFRRTTHLGYEVVDLSGRHGWPEVVEVRGRGIFYDVAEIEFAMDTTKWSNGKRWSRCYLDLLGTAREGTGACQFSTNICESFRKIGMFVNPKFASEIGWKQGEVSVLPHYFSAYLPSFPVSFPC